MKFTDETLRRALRTFLQAFVPAFLVGLNEIDFTGGGDYLRGAMISLLIPTLAAALAAVMNLEPGERGGGTMSFATFVRTYRGKATDYDGCAGVQCVDLAKLYIDKVLGVKPQSIGNAHAYYDDFDSTYLKKHFTKIPYRAGVKAQAGDLVVWRRKYNGTSPYGHIAIAAGRQTATHITTYDQNWGGKAMKEVEHRLDGVAGFLRPLSAAPRVTYFRPYRGSGVSIADALYAVGAASSYAYRRRIAAANGIKSYRGTAKQNTQMLSLLKQGKLIKP